MASSRKKQDEKHLKILRNLVSLPGNKQCFDCNQRGPTYVNVTIGSFVCTTCSGLLRGLTPPHRVKSISMTTFTSEEIESLQSRGNEYCRKVWLALYDSDNVHNSKDEHLVRDFMVSKYEKKLYYMEPSSSLKNGNSLFSGQSMGRANVESSRSQHYLTNSSPQVPQSSATLKIPQIQGNSFKTNTSNVSPSDPFRINALPLAQPKSQIQGNQSEVQCQEMSSFANFENNPIFISSDVTNCFPSLKPNVTTEDKYAALKDLDCLMKMQQGSPQDQGNLGNGWTTTNTDRSSSLNPFQTDIGNNNVVNPFRSGLIQQIENNNGSGEYIRTGTNAITTNHSNNPINPWGTDATWTTNGGGLSTSQTFPFTASNWAGKGNLNVIPGSSNNPFL